MYWRSCASSQVKTEVNWGPQSGISFANETDGGLGVNGVVQSGCKMRVLKGSV